MAQQALTEEQLVEAVETFKLNGSVSAAAKALGLHRATFQNRLRQAAAKGLMGYEPVLPGFEVKTASAKVDGVWIKTARESGPEFELPPGQVLKGVSALVDQDGRVRAKWVKSKEDTPDLASILDTIKGAFKDYEGGAGRAVVPTLSAKADDLATLVPCNDWHINMLSWGRETGTNWDLKIAEKALGDTVLEVIYRAPPSSCAIVLGGGDMLHSDDNEARTKRSGNALDVDGRHQKGLEVAHRLKVLAIDEALKTNARVIVRILQGNHDEMTSIGIAYFLLAWYKDEPRVTVDVDPSLFFFMRFGKVLLGATHGHTVKLRKMPAIMAGRRAEDWGITLHRYVHGFHVHHKEMLGWDEDGVVGETHQAPVPQDSYHYGAGFQSGSSMQSITYHQQFGEFSRVRKAVLFDASDAAVDVLGEFKSRRA
jgi:hypothetical protein